MMRLTRLESCKAMTNPEVGDMVDAIGNALSHAIRLLSCWYDSLALGVAVAILSDDQLLTSVKSLVPRIS